MHLERILATTRATVAERKQRMPLADLERRAALHQPRGFAHALRERAAQGPAIIAELKKASPSKGLIRPEFDVAALADSLKAGGAAALATFEPLPHRASLEDRIPALAQTRSLCHRSFRTLRLE